jgi:hypothetical protein
MAPGRLLQSFAAALVVLNVLATVVAVVLNWPSQFGMVGTNARREFLTSGTAISAPPLPVVLLVVVAALGGRADRWRWVGIAAAYLAAVTVAIGGFGELVAEPTEDTPKAVLVGAGITWLAIAVGLAVLATAAPARRPADPAAAPVPGDGRAG